MKEICEKHGEYEVVESYGFKNCCPACLAEHIKKNEQKMVEQSKIYRSEKISEYLKNANVPERFKGCSFENYKITSEQHNNAYNACKDYFQQYDKVKKNGESLFLCGSCGTGKTHLAIAILRALILTETGCGTYTTTLKMLRDIRSSYQDRNKTEQQIINKYVNTELLILDEVGLQYGSEGEKILLFEVINGRYENVKPTILISNLAPKGISEYMGERVFDRLKDSCNSLVVFDWNSYRVTK